MAEQNREPKQVILARRDLQMSPGKLAAQAAHASLGAVLPDLHNTQGSITNEWTNSGQTKVVLGVNSQEELLVLYERAVKEGFLAYLVLDQGRTEFSGPTYTCVGIGPEPSEEVDKLTGHLRLY